MLTVQSIDKVSSKSDSRSLRSSLLLVLSLCAISGIWIRHFVDFGTHYPKEFYDTRGYYLATKVALEGDNPYDPAALMDREKKLSDHAPLGYYHFPYPPWFWLMWSPMTLFEYSTSRTVWLVLNIFFALATVILMSLPLFRGGREIASIALVFLLSLYIFPLFHLRVWGQTGLLIACSIAALFLALRNRYDWLTGLFLVPLLIKPHVWYLVLLGAGLWLTLERRWRAILAFALFFAILLVATQLIFPTLISAWLRQALTVPGFLFEYRTATLSSAVRPFLPQVLRGAASLVLPCLTLILFSTWLLVRRPQQVDLWLIPAICLSSITTGYSWIHDQSALLVPQAQMAVVAGLESNPHRRLLLLACPLVPLLFMSFPFMLAFPLIAGIRESAPINFIEETYRYICPLIVLASWLVQRRLKGAFRAEDYVPGSGQGEDSAHTRLV